MMWNRTAASVLSGLLLAGLPTLGCDEGGGTSNLSDASILFGEGEFPVDAGPGRDAGRPDAPDTGGGPDDAGDSGVSPDIGPDGGGPMDAGDPCVEAPAFTLSVEEALARSEELDGRIVAVTGVVRAGEAQCGDDPCDDGTSCCNTCRAPLELGGIELLAHPGCAATATVACLGGACDPLVCTPPDLGLPATYRGVLRSSPGLRLELISSAP